MRSPASEARRGTREGSERRLGARPKQRKTAACLPAQSRARERSVLLEPKKPARPTLGASVRHAVDRILLAFSSTINPYAPTGTHTVAASSRFATMASFTPNPNFDKENSNPKDWAYHLGEWQALTSQPGMQSDADTDLPICSSTSYLRMLAAEASHCLHQGGLCGLPQAAQRPCWTQLYRAFAVAQVSTFGMCLGRDTRD